MARGKELTAVGRGAVEPALRQEPVEQHERGVRERKPVGPEPERHRPRGEERHREGGGEQHVLPGGDDVERRTADAGIPQLRHHQVVRREPDDQDGERDPGEALAHVIATSVRPRLTMRTGPGKRLRRSPLPSRWFSRAHSLPVRS